MSKLNTQPRTFTTKTTYRTVLDPRLDVNAPYFKNREPSGFRESDYISVPRLDTQGEWALAYMLPDEQLVHLAVMANHLKPKSDRKTYAQRFEEKRQKRVKASKERRNVA